MPKKQQIQNDEDFDKSQQEFQELMERLDVNIAREKKELQKMIDENEKYEKENNAKFQQFQQQLQQFNDIMLGQLLLYNDEELDEELEKLKKEIEMEKQLGKNNDITNREMLTNLKGATDNVKIGNSRKNGGRQ